MDLARGRAVAIAWDNTLFAADLTTGVRSAFVSDALGGPLDNFFTDIALDRDNGRVVAVLQFAGRIDAIDGASQIRTVVSSAGVGAGPAPASPYRLSLDEQNQVAFVVDRVLAAVFAVDLQSGDRVIMSK